MSKQAKPVEEAPTDDVIRDYGDDFTPDGTSEMDDFSGIINTNATIEVDKRLLEDETQEIDVEPEVEAESEAEPEIEAEAEAEPEAAKPEAEPRIPKRRLDKVIEQRNQLDMRLKELERQLEETRREQAKKAEVSDEQLIAWNNEANKALLDGELDKATELQKKVWDALRQKPVEQQGQIDVNDLKTRLKDELRVEQKLEVVFREHPELDTNSESFSEDLLDEAIELQDYYVARGAPLVDAIDKAINMLKREGKLRGSESTKPKAPYRETKPDVQAKAALAAKQPREPASSRKTEADLQTDVTTLTLEEYAALSEQQKARLRGDFL